MVEIKPKYCGYNCGKKIYWDVNKNQYLELMSKQRHICPNRNKPKETPPTTTAGTTTTSYHRISTPTTERPKMANSFELLQGSPRFVREQYELLSQLIRDSGGKVHGSQRGGEGEHAINILVYYEVPELTKLGIQDVFNKFLANKKGEGK